MAWTPRTKLADLVDGSTFLFFSILKLDWDWLRVKPSEWENFESYREARDFVRTVKVTNDVAEHGIELVGDYTQILTKDEDMREKLLQGVEWNRRMFPNFKKKTLNAGI